MMINFAVSFLHQYLPPTVLTAYLPLLLQTLTWTPLFPEEAISEIADTFLLLFPSISHDIFMGLCFCFRLSWYTAQVSPNAFRHSRWSFSVMLCKSPQWMNSRQCLLSTVSNCCCKVIQQGFLCHWLDKCFCHFPENFLLLLSSDFSPFWLSAMYKW